MNSTWFDDLTKALATATTRRLALRRIGGMLGGSALAGLFPGLARANGDDPCISFCVSVFGEDLQAVECIADAIHHKGLCYTCGPKSVGGTKPICCPENSHGKCSSYHSATCCSSGQTCQNGLCVTPTTTTSTTTTTTTTSTTTTTRPPALGCTSGSPCETVCPDTSNPFCYCGTTTAGVPVCYYAQNGCGSPQCTVDADCGAGNVCVNLTDGCGGCSTAICEPICTS